MSRSRPAVALLLALITACGPSSETTASGGDSEGASGAAARLELADSALAPSPTYLPWSGGDPTWPLSVRETEAVLGAFLIEGGDPRGIVSWMPEACYAIEPLGEGNSFHSPPEACFYPTLRRLVGDDALRFFVQTDEERIVFDLVGDGPVRVANVGWGDSSRNDYPEPQVLTPRGFMSSSPHEWAPYAAAEREAGDAAVFGRIIAATGGSELGAYNLEPVGDTQIQAPVHTPTGWSVSTTSTLSAGCGACAVGFAARFVLEFSEDGVPVTARFDGYCHNDVEAADIAAGLPVGTPDVDAIAALMSELPLCAPGIAWENPSRLV